MAGLRIAVDARPLCHPGTGIYRYARELLRRMIPMGGEWFLYSTHPFDQEDYRYPNCHCRIATDLASVGGSQASQYLFPYWLRKDSIQSFWATRHHLPLIFPRGIFSVLSVHDMVWRSQRRTMRLSRWLTETVIMPRSINKADRIVTGTHFIADELESTYPGIGSKMYTLPYASCFTGKAVADQARDADCKFFLFVGTMEPRKNLATLLRAYRHYIDQSEDPIRLGVVGGEGWGGVDLPRLVAESGLDDWVTIWGKVDDERLSSLYASTYALVMPSFYEGFGLPVVEAMAFGKPVIVSHNSAMAEVAGDAAMLVDPYSERSIARALVEITADGNLHARLVNCALARSEYFDWGYTASRLYGLLSECG